MSPASARELLRALPAVHRLLEEEVLADLPRPRVIAAARRVLEAQRRSILAGEQPALDQLADQVRAEALRDAELHLQPVINASGVVLHTNLGRAPLHPEVVEAVAERAGRYSNLELDLRSGRRGERLTGIQRRLEALVGTPAALGVNNNAAALILLLSAHAAGREVLVSRGELVEIGGSFRLPEIMELAGVKLVEVGTTNRTRVEDYQRAIGPESALILKVHPSNFYIQGFSERPPVRDLTGLGLPVVEDIGSGMLWEDGGPEPSVEEALRAGVELVCFSGDKLLGGPQAGLILGREEWVQACRRHPLYRALRLDKLSLVALEATLKLWEEERLPPVQRALREEGPAEELFEALSQLSPALVCELQEAAALPGGGSMPDQQLPGRCVAILSPEPERLAKILRTGYPSVLGRVHHGKLLLFPRTLLPGELHQLTQSVRHALAIMTR